MTSLVGIVLQLLLVRLILALIVCVPIMGQDPEPAELRRARTQRDEVRRLVEEGALPRLRLLEAEKALAEAQDHAVLARYLYGSMAVEDLNEEQAKEMVDAAVRLTRAEEARLASERRLVEEGGRPRNVLADFEERVARARRTQELAEQRGRLIVELAGIVHQEQQLGIALEQAPAEAAAMALRYDGDGTFSLEALKQIVLAFEKKFDRKLPISARGETALHRAMGFDHRGRVDVALNPDQEEGAWLMAYLVENRIPYFAFRRRVPGKATAPHIHIGPASQRLGSSD